jgi:hypothetical protein
MRTLFGLRSTFSIYVLFEGTRVHTKSPDAQAAQKRMSWSHWVDIAAVRHNLNRRLTQSLPALEPARLETVDTEPRTCIINGVTSEFADANNFLKEQR